MRWTALLKDGGPWCAGPDDGGASEYKTRIESVLGEEDPGVRFVALPAMARNDWRDLHADLRETGCNVVVFDVLSQLISGDLNSGPDVATMIDGLRLFTRQGIPVVMVAHSSEKSGPGGKPDKPLGHTSISGGFRWRVMLSKSKTGVWTLEADGNRGDNHSLTFTAAPNTFDVPDFQTESAKDGGQLRHEASTRKRQRDAETLDQRAQYAQLLDGKKLNKSEAGRLLAEKFGRDPHTHRNNLSQEAYPVRQDDAGVWRSTVAV